MYHVPLVQLAESASSILSSWFASAAGSATLTTSQGVKERRLSSVRVTAFFGLLENFADANV